MPIFTGHHEDRWLQVRLLCGDVFAVISIVATLVGYAAPIGLWFGTTWYVIALSGAIYARWRAP